MTSTHYCMLCKRPFEVDIPLNSTVNMRVPTHCPEHRVNVEPEPIDSKSQSAFRAQTTDTDNKHHRRRLDITIGGPTGEGKTLLAILVMSLLRRKLDVGDSKQLILQLLGEDDPDNLPCVADATYLLRKFALQEGLDISIRTTQTARRAQMPGERMPATFSSSEARKVLSILPRDFASAEVIQMRMLLVAAAQLIDSIQLSLIEALDGPLDVGTRNYLTMLLDAIKRGHP